MVVNNAFYYLLCSNLGVEIFSKEREHQKKGALKQNIEAFQYNLYWDLKKIPVTLYTYVLAKILQNDVRFCPKHTFLQLKHYTQNIFLTLLSTTCEKIQQIRYVTFDNMSHFSGHNSSVFFSSIITYYLQKQQIKVHILRLSTAHVKILRIAHVFFQTKSQFFFKAWITLQCYVRSLFCSFLAEAEAICY